MNFDYFKNPKTAALVHELEDLDEQIAQGVKIDQERNARGSSTRARAAVSG